MIFMKPEKRMSASQDSLSPECMDMSRTYSVWELTPKWATALMRLLMCCC